jgi:hypothetical protein
MTGALLSVLAFAALFAGFALINRGREGGHGCGACDKECSHGQADRNVIRELKR